MKMMFENKFNYTKQREIDNIKIFIEFQVLSEKLNNSINISCCIDISLFILTNISGNIVWLKLVFYIIYNL